MGRYLQLLMRRDYALLWSGATISALGDGMSFVALVWLLIERGGTPGDVGLLSAVYTAPVVIGGLAAGVILDRFDPRRVLAADNAIRGLAVASVPIASALGVLTTTQLFVVAGIYGLLFMTSAAGIPSLIVRLVNRDDLTTANAMESISFGIAGLVGPSFAGVVIAILGSPAVLAIDAVTYGVFVVLLLLMREGKTIARPEAATADAVDFDIGPVVVDPAVERVPPPRSATSGGLGPAIRFILGSPAVLTITGMYMCGNLGGGIIAVVAPIYARDVLHGDATTFGLLLSALTLGELVGLIVVGAIRWPFPLGRSIAGAICVGAVFQLLLLFKPPIPLILVVLAGWGVAESSLTPWAQTIRMRLIPAEMRGRVFALLRTLMQSTRPIGSILAGILLAGGDVVPALGISFLLAAISGVVGLWIPSLSREATAEA
jgi:MFS family permease